MDMTMLRYMFLPSVFIVLSGYLMQTSLRNPRIAWWRIIVSSSILLFVCFEWNQLAASSRLGAVVAFLCTVLATVPLLCTSIWVAYTALRWRKLVALVMLITTPAAFFFSIIQGSERAPDVIAQRATAQNGTQIAHALEAYNREHKRYPLNLSSLVPTYLPRLPEALTTQGTGWLYHTNTLTYTLGYWYDSDKYLVDICRYSSTKPEWECKIENNQNGRGWAPFEPVYSP